MNRLLLALTAALWAVGLATWGQPTSRVTRYDESSGLSQAHATQVVQGHDGFLWFATWNGLNRFDGYEFRRMTTQAGDGCNMPTDRIRDIWLNEQGNLYCMVDDGLYLFNTRTYRFSDIATEQERRHALALRQSDTTRGQYNGSYIEFTDRQGLKWELRGDAVYCQQPVSEPAQRLTTAGQGQTRCLARDRQGRIWVASKGNNTLSLYDAQLRLVGYVAHDGRVLPQPVTFGAPVYSFAQTDDGSIWLGAKPDGLFRLRETAPGARFSVELIDRFEGHGVYDIKPDRSRHCLWLATLGGGIGCLRDYDQARPTVVRHVGNYPYTAASRVRYIHLVSHQAAPGAPSQPASFLLATTTDGLVVGRLAGDAALTTFKRHVKEANRPNSLSCNATMDVLEAPDGRLLVSTESGGVCQIVSDNLWADTLSFRRLPMNGGWPTDVVLSMSDAKGKLLLTSSNQLIVYDTATGSGSVFDAWFFNHPYRFSEVHPLPLADGRWLIGSSEGAFTLAPSDMHRETYVPPIVLTAVSKQRPLAPDAQSALPEVASATDLAVNQQDTLWLAPDERSLTIHFAALDYTDARRVSYAFRLGDASAPWNALGHNHSVTLLDLKPGTYELWLHATNANGMWVDNQRRLVIVVRPTFWETPWARLLLFLLAAGAAIAIARTIIYIRHIKRQRQETLAAYLDLMARHEPPAAEAAPAGAATAAAVQPAPVVPAPPVQPATSAEDDAFMRRLLAFVDENLSNADANISDMAEAAAVSRSGLQRKMKQLTGITPLDFLREARIKRACQLLERPGAVVSEVAYQCGFSDPKYFSRSFKKSTGFSPTEYKTRSAGPNA